MKEARLEDVIDEYFETHEICTMEDLYHFVHDYREKHNVYVPYDHEELEYVLYTLGLDKFYLGPQSRDYSQTRGYYMPVLRGKIQEIS